MDHNFMYPFTDSMNNVKFVGKTYLFVVQGKDVNITESLLDLIVVAANKGLAVECIKFIRSNFNLSLKEAKDVFDTIRRHTSSNVPF